MKIKNLWVATTQIRYPTCKGARSLDSCTSVTLVSHRCKNCHRRLAHFLWKSGFFFEFGLLWVVFFACFSYFCFCLKKNMEKTNGWRGFSFFFSTMLKKKMCAQRISNSKKHPTLASQSKHKRCEQSVGTPPPNKRVHDAESPLLQPCSDRINKKKRMEQPITIDYNRSGFLHKKSRTGETETAKRKRCKYVIGHLRFQAICQSHGISKAISQSLRK